jgi:hypothetical protein
LEFGVDNPEKERRKGRSCVEDTVRYVFVMDFAAAIRRMCYVRCDGGRVGVDVVVRHQLCYHYLHYCSSVPQRVPLFCNSYCGLDDAGPSRYQHEAVITQDIIHWEIRRRYKQTQSYRNRGIFGGIAADCSQFQFWFLPLAFP